MKLKNYLLLDKEFLNTCYYLYPLDIPMRISFPMRKILEILEKEEKSVKESYNSIWKKYGVEIIDEVGSLKGYDIAKATQENKDKFQSEYSELVNLEFEIPIDTKFEININDNGFKNLNLSSEKIFKLEPLFNFKM